MNFANNVVLLGASSDIGAALLRRASQSAAARVIAVTRRPAAAPAQASSNVEYLGGIDLTDEACLDRMADFVRTKFSQPFSVIHCVGDFWVHRPLCATPFLEIQRMITSHVITLFGAAHRLTPLMKANGGGRLVAFSCNSVGYSYPDMSPFTASKAAVESFIKCYANENSEFGISASALALPTILTEKVLKEKTIGDPAKYLTPDDLAEIVVGQILTQSPAISGNIVKVFKFNRAFYHSSYYDRNPSLSS
jgi:NAD(P)-dependent dehydrogenase (short-subunit alcohol dehydrogenase family)